MSEDLGLGVVVSMKDAFSQNAGRVSSSMQSLDATVAASSERMTRNMDRIQKGAMLMGAGLALMALPVGLVASTAATQRALGELSSLGVQDLRAIEDAAESFTNTWAGSSKAEFITASYDVRSALSGLTDEAVGSFTAMAALTGKATKATTEEMVGTFTTAYGIFKPIMAELSDAEWAETFAGAMAQTVASFKTNGRQMADAIKNIGAVAASSNVPLEEQLAILGQLQTTMPGSEAGTLYKAFIMKAAEAGEALGLELVGSSGRLKSIIPILKEIQGKFPDLSQAAAQVEIKKAFGSDEAVKFLLQMSQGVAALETNIQSVERAMRTGTTVTKEMARSMNLDIGARLKLVGQQMRNLAEILGRTLLPVVTPRSGRILSGNCVLPGPRPCCAWADSGAPDARDWAWRRAHRRGRRDGGGRNDRPDASGDQGRARGHGPEYCRSRRGLYNLPAAGGGHHRRGGAGRLPAEEGLGVPISGASAT